MRFAPLAAAIASFGLVASLAHAQPASPSPPSPSPSPTTSSSHEVAAAAFEQARQAIDAGDCAGALPKLDESLKAEPSIGAHLSYADCFESIDPYLAFGHLRDALLIAFLRHDDRYASTEKRASALVGRIAAVRVITHVADLEESDFQLRIDGKFIDRFHLSSPLGLRPGEHTLSASTSDGRRWNARVNAEVGKVITLDVELQEPQPASEPPAEPKPRPSSRGSTQRTVGLVVSGVGLATIAAGAAFGVVTIARRNDLDRACNGSADNCTGSSQTVNPILASAHNSATASTVLFTVGAAVLAGGIVLWLLAPTSSSAKTGRRLDPALQNISVAALGQGAVFRW